MRIVAHAPASLLGFPSELSQNTRSEHCILVKYLYPVIYWRLYKVRVGVRGRSYNMRAWNYNCSKLLELLVIVTVSLLGLQRSDRLLKIYLGPVV